MAMQCGEHVGKNLPVFTCMENPYHVSTSKVYSSPDATSILFIISMPYSYLISRDFNSVIFVTGKNREIKVV